MGFKCGIVGLPNVGKSTLFNVLTKAGIAAANYPFCTIEPNVGIVPMPDKRLQILADIVKPQKVMPTSMEFVDIAGLVKGAAQGEGLGNKFLSHIRETDAIAHVVRCFQDDDIVHVAGQVDPLADIDVINLELALADLDSVDKALLKTTKNAKTGDKIALQYKAVLELIKPHLDQGLPVRTLQLTAEQTALIKPLQLLTAKPMLYVANVAEDGFKNNNYLESVAAHATREHAQVVTLCAKLEEDMLDLSDAEKLEFLQELGLEETGLERLIQAGYALLGLQTYFTAGVQEVRAWTVRRGATAPQAAARIHNDFEKGFIRAEVIAYTDFVTYRGEQGAKEVGKWRLEGKEYIVQDGDVMHFRFNV